MTDVEEVVRAVSGGSRRQISITRRDGEQGEPFAGDGAERDNAFQVHHANLPLQAAHELDTRSRETAAVMSIDGIEAVDPSLASLRAPSEVLPDDYVAEERHTC